MMLRAELPVQRKRTLYIWLIADAAVSAQRFSRAGIAKILQRFHSFRYIETMSSLGEAWAAEYGGVTLL
jgi:hypothetical protein